MEGREEESELEGREEESEWREGRKRANGG